MVLAGELSIAHAAAGIVIVAVGLSFLGDFTRGAFGVVRPLIALVLVLWLIGVENIPEGIALMLPIAIPLYAALLVLRGPARLYEERRRSRGDCRCEK